MAGLDEGQQIPEIILFQGHNTYLLNDLITFDRPFFVGCIREPRKTIQKKNIPDDQYWFATYSKRNNTWSPATPESRKAKILISEEWVHNNLPKFTGVQDPYKYKPLPPLLELSDAEKFRDEAGNIYEVEVRGEKTRQDIRFKWTNVSRLFEMEPTYHLSQKLDEREYDLFCSNGQVSSRQNRSTYQISTYLTYKGLLKIITTSRSYNISRVTKFLNTPLMKELQQSQNMIILKPCKEQQTIQAIMEAFPEETMYTQYMIGPYRVDLYIKGKLVVECDENNHQ